MAIRVSFAPLYEVALEAANRCVNPDLGWNQYAQHQGSTAAIADQLGVSSRTVERWKSAGDMPWLMADRLATALGHHPAELWCEEWRQLELMR